MGHAGGKPANGRQTARKFDLVFDTVDRLGIAHGKQRPDALAPLGDEIERDLDAASVFQLDFALRYRPLQRKRVQYDTAQLIGIGEDALDQHSPVSLPVAGQ